MATTEEQMRMASERMQAMNPETLRAQANALRSMDPNTIRQMNPAMANFSDAQIREAATQMEQMANDPRLMQQAADELKSMKPEQLEEMKKTMTGGGSDSILPNTEPGGYPIGTRVVLQDLKAAAQYNGKSGVVKGPKANGRQNVFVEGADGEGGGKAMLLKPENLEPEEREVESLTVAEAQAVLKVKGVPEAEYKAAGLDKAQLLELVEDKVMPDDDLSVLIAEGLQQSARSASAGGGGGAAVSEAMLQKGAEAMSTMDPARMRMQANALRNMDPDVVRRSNPQMASFSDAQIKQAADQMEMMASNPEMMKMAAAQMKNMTPQQMDEMRRAMAGGGGGGGAMPGMPSPGGGAGMPMGGAGGAANPMAGLDPSDPSALLKMDPAQLKAAFKMLKSNPAMLKSMQGMIPGGAGMSEEAMAKQFDQLADMSDEQLASFLKMAGTAQAASAKAKAAWDTANGLFGGHLFKVLVLLVLCLVALLVKWLFFGASAALDSEALDGAFGDHSGAFAGSASAPPKAAPGAAVEVEVSADGEVEDEFD